MGRRVSGKWSVGRWVGGSVVGWSVVLIKPHPSCYLTSIMDETHYGPVIALFCATLTAFFSYVRGIYVTNHFSLLLIVRYILAI